VLRGWAGHTGKTYLQTLISAPNQEPPRNLAGYTVVFIPNININILLDMNDGLGQAALRLHRQRC
jgi:hypothetical protein